MMRTQQLKIALWSMVILGVVAWSGMRLGAAQTQIATANATRSAIEREVTQVQPSPQLALQAAVSLQ